MNLQAPNLAARNKDTLLILLWTLLCFFAMSYNPEEIPPYHSDEYLYVQSLKNMLDAKDYLTPQYYGKGEALKNRYNKPIFFYWLMILACKILGPSLAAARMGSAIFGSLCVFVTFRIARRLFNRETAFLSALILPGFSLHFHLSRFARPDMTLIFFILSALYFFTRIFQEEKPDKWHYYLFYLSLSLGFLTKGPVAVIIPGLAVAVFLLASGNRNLLSGLRPLSGTLIFLAVNLPWFLAMVLLHGKDFTGHIFTVELQDRVLHEGKFSLYYFLLPFSYYFLPWSLFFVSALAFFKNRWKDLFSGQNDSLLFCFTWLVITIIFSTLLRVQHSRYLAPASPAIAIITGYFLCQLLKSDNGFHSKFFKIPLFLTLAYYLGVAIFFGLWGIIFNSILSVPGPLIFLPFFLITSIIFLLILYRYKKMFPLLVGIAFTQIVGLAIVCGDGVPFVNAYPMKGVAEGILKYGSGKEKVYLFHLSNERSKLGIRTMYWVTPKNNIRKLQRLIAAEKKIFLVMRKKTWEEKFQDTPLVPLAIDIRLKSVKDLPGVFRSLVENGLTNTLEMYVEEIVLLANHSLSQKN